jgi:hypothetical protein
MGMIRAFLILGSMLLVWISGYVSGVLPWLGYASWTRSSFGAGAISIVGENRRGIDLGPETFFFFEGQELVFEYETEIRQGSLWFYVYQPFDGVLGSGDSQYVTANGKGRWTVPIRKSAFYHVSVEPSPTHGKPGGWDLSYSLKWGAAFARGSGELSVRTSR